MLEAVLVFALLASVRTWGAYESKAVQAQDTSASFFQYAFSSTPAALGSSGGQVRTWSSVFCSFLVFSCPTRPALHYFGAHYTPKGKVHGTRAGTFSTSRFSVRTCASLLSSWHACN